MSANPIADVKGILILIIVIVIGFLYWRVSSKLADYDAMKSENAELSRRIDSMEDRQADYDQALLDKAARTAWEQGVRNNLTTHLQGVKQNDPDASAYLDTVIPDSVRKSWPASSGVPSTDASATGANRNQ